MEGYRHGGRWCWSFLRCPTVGIFSSFLLLTATLPQASADLANETSILLLMKQGWGNPRELNSWSSSFNTCTWVFVVCDSANTTIVQLAITGGSVNSSLPASIGELVNLEQLTVQSWGLMGEIPTSIGSLRNLTTLSLSENMLSGPIPPVLGNLTQLTALDLSVNTLSGEIPVELSQLRLLSYLNLNTNGLNGSLPSWIGGFPELTGLFLQTNSFQGSIPLEFGNLTKLVTLSVSYAGLSGGLPPELGNLTSIVNLNLAGNTLVGSIPDSYANLKSLSSVTFGTNFLDGSIPSWMGNLTNLTGIDFSSNLFTGFIPDTLGNVASLNNLDLHQNRLSGPIPTQLSQLSNLVFLYLEQNSLTGPIPTQFTQMSNLSILDLSGNFLSGAIPPDLTALPSLTQLLLQDNCLNGTIPSYNASDVNLYVNFGAANNSNCFNASQICKCAAPPSQPPLSLAPSPSLVAGGENGSSKTAQHVYIAVGVIAGSLLALTAVLIIFLRRSRKSQFSNLSSIYRGSVRQYKLSEIKAATNNFTTQIGEGGFATVYKAVFKDGSVAAVKRFNKKKPAESFEQEVDLLSHLNHRFLVNLVGYCEEGEEHLLLFDYMDRGSLFQNLHGPPSSIPLTWDERVKVLVHVAYGIDYLHYGTDPPMIHRDIKSANILLSSSGGSLIAKIADFGMGKQTVIESNESETVLGNEPPKPHTTRIVGSPGYFDPEYVHTSVLSPKSDIYSYGIVLLELITGRRSILEEGLSLANWAKPYLDQEDMSIADLNLEKGGFSEEQLLAVADLARRCIDTVAHNRPTIRDVLEFIKEVFRVEVRMVNPSIRTVSTGEISVMQSRELNLSKDLTGTEASMNSYTHSEILPRD